MKRTSPHPGVAPAAQRGISPAGLAGALESLHDDAGRSLRDIADERPTLVCLLRHNGCTFCRETIAALAQQREGIVLAGLNIAVVGMSAQSEPLRLLGERFGLVDVSWIADPDRLLYRALEVRRGGILQLLGPSVIWAGVRGMLRGHGIGRVEGDPFQLPGTAVIFKGRILRQYVHQSAADRPDYRSFVCEVEP